MIRKLYVLFGLAVLFFYGMFALSGQELGRSKKQFVPKGMRGATVGAGSVWYRGYHGGK